MSERGFWDDNLLSLQKKYWESWSEISSKALGGAVPPPKSPWEMAQEHWWQAVSPAAPDLAKDFMTRMMDQGKQLFRMAELFSGNAQTGGKTPDWKEVLNQFSAEMGSAGSLDSGTEANDRRHKMMGCWELPFDNWQRMASTLSLFPGDLLRNMPHGGSQTDMNRLLSAPGLGYTREEQAQQQELMRLIAEYKRALQAYNRFFTDIGSESVKRLHEKLEHKSQKSEAIDSARTLYDTWVETCEEVYGERVRTSEYAQINGRLVNASMGVKQHIGVLIDENLGALNMPTRKELRTLQTRMQENRRENKRLRSEVDALKAQINDLAALQKSARPTATTKKRKTTPRKKSTPKR